MPSGATTPKGTEHARQEPLGRARLIVCVGVTVLLRLMFLGGAFWGGEAGGGRMWSVGSGTNVLLLSKEGLWFSCYFWSPPVLKHNLHYRSMPPCLRAMK